MENQITYQLGSLNITPVVYDVTTAGNYIFCAGGYKGLTVIDQHNPAALQEIGSLPTTKSIYSLCIHGHYLYVSFDYSDGMDIFDISTPATPTLQNSFSYDQAVGEMIVHGTLMFAGTYPNGMRILNLADPLHPVEKEKHEIGIIQRFAMNEQTLAAIDEWEGLFFFRLQDSSIGDTPAHIELDINPVKMFVYGSTLYFPLLDKNGFAIGIKILDLTDPLEPVDRGKSQFYPADFLFQGSYAYLLQGADLLVLDVSTHYQPAQIVKKTLKSTQKTLVIHNDCLYAFGGSTGTKKGCDVIDISTPASPVVHHMIEHQPGFTRVAGAGNALLALDHNSQLYRIDISDPANPVMESQPMLTDLIADFWIRNQSGYMTDNNNLLSIYDLSDPFHPVFKTTRQSALLSSRPILYDGYGCQG